MNLTERLGWPHYSEEEAEIAKQVILSNKVNYWTGTECRSFEHEFADYVGAKYAVAVANGTVALDLALKALEIGPGDEVIVTSRTFLASVSSIVNAGASPVFADVSLNSQNICSDSVREMVSDRTRAIMCVHLAGWPCDMDQICALALEHGLSVIEDCAQAHGALYKGRPVGSLGDVAAFSFCQDKIMSTGGEGGMVTTSSNEIWGRVWSYKDHGKNYDLVNTQGQRAGFRWVHDSFGTNWRMTEVQAAIGRFQLKKLDEWHTLRNRFQSLLWNEAGRLPGIRVPDFKCEGCRGCEYPKSCSHAAYKAYIFIENSELSAGWDRDRIIEAINDSGVPCFHGSCSEVYLEKAFDPTGFRPVERLPNAQQLGETSIMFQVHPTLTQDNMLDAVRILKNVMTLATS